MPSMLSSSLVALCPAVALSARIFLAHQADSTCVALSNQGSFSTVAVSVGTPPQTFDLVADTGSDSLIVESCVCEDQGHCKKDGVCFRGSEGKSTSFSLRDKPKEIQITYGSGPVQAVASSDQVSVGSIGAKMDDSVLLMVNNQLEHGLELQGILGLGLPSRGKSPAEGKGFLDFAKISRFSMCFNENGKDGVLRLGSNVNLGKPLGSVGQVHWGVDFRGVTVNGGTPQSALGDLAFCTTKEAGQATPCGAIVDSGTTLIMAPKVHLAKLFMQICDAWPACKERAAAALKSDTGESDEKASSAGTKHGGTLQDRVAAATAQVAAAVQAFTHEAAKCNLDSMPTLSFHVRGADGTKQALELAPNDYMLETSVQSTTKVKKWLMGVIPVEVQVPTAGKQKVCVPAFHTHDYNTKLNGPVWIFGTPFFYKYTVAYDRKSSPPAVSFGAEGCSKCSSAGTASLLASGSGVRRFLGDDPRVPYFNTSLPM